MYFSHFFISLVTAGEQEVFMEKDVCLSYCIVFLLYDFTSCNTVIIHLKIHSKFHKKLVPPVFKTKSQRISLPSWFAVFIGKKFEKNYH